MRRDPALAKPFSLQSLPASLLQNSVVVALLLAACCVVVAKSRPDQGQTLIVQVEAPLADVLKVVQEVSQDQIIHGTYSYEKERILYGAHSTDAAHVFGVWKGPGKAYYKVAGNVLSPRFFKDTGDIGTISVRYVVQELAQNSTTLQIDAMFVDARNVKHPSLGNVESSEYVAIQQHLKNLQDNRRQTQEAKAAGTTKPALPAPPVTAEIPAAESVGNVPATGLTAPELQQRVQALRHEVELRVKDSGAPLKSAPFQGAATLESLPGSTEVLVEILTPYWYGVETENGHRGWVHHSHLEPLP
jgi:hypothetical protein